MVHVRKFHRSSGNEEAWNKVPASSLVNVGSQNEHSGNTGGRKERVYTMKTKKEVYREIEEAFGLVPTFMKTIPESTLENEWELFKKVQMEDGAIPNKYRELIGLGLSAVSKCRYCTLFHTEMAKLFGATDKEIEEAVHYAKSSAGWSAYLNGMQVDYEQFKDELRRAGEHARAMKKAA